jgi:hypothetical protein
MSTSSIPLPSRRRIRSSSLNDSLPAVMGPPLASMVCPPAASAAPGGASRHAALLGPHAPSERRRSPSRPDVVSPAAKWRYRSTSMPRRHCGRIRPAGASRRSVIERRSGVLLRGRGHRLPIAGVVRPGSHGRARLGQCRPRPRGVPSCANPPPQRAGCVAAHLDTRRSLSCPRDTSSSRKRSATYPATAATYEGRFPPSWRPASRRGWPRLSHDGRTRRSTTTSTCAVLALITPRWGVRQSRRSARIATE